MFSADGNYLSFVEGDPIYSSKRQIQKAAVSGGAATTLFDYDMFHSGDWAKDGWIYWTAQYPGGIVRIRDSGGAVEPVTNLDAAKVERSHRYAHLLPDGQALIYTVSSGDTGTYDDARIQLFDLAHQREEDVADRRNVGCLMLLPATSSMRARASSSRRRSIPDRKEVTGGPFEALSGVQMSTDTGAASSALSRRGDLVYVPGSVEGGRRTLVWVDCYRARGSAPARHPHRISTHGFRRTAVPSQWRLKGQITTSTSMTSPVE